MEEGSAFPFSISTPIQNPPVYGGEQAEWILNCEEETSHKFAWNQTDIQLAGSHNARYCDFVLGLYALHDKTPSRCLM